MSAGYVWKWANEDWIFGFAGWRFSINIKCDRFCLQSWESQFQDSIPKLFDWVSLFESEFE